MKKLTQDLENKILTEAVMFLDWYVDYKNILLTTDEVRELVKRLFIREDVLYTTDDLDNLGSLVFIVEGKIAKQLRMNFDFDQNISLFCKGINLSLESL